MIFCIFIVFLILKNADGLRLSPSHRQRRALTLLSSTIDEAEVDVQTSPTDDDFTDNIRSKQEKIRKERLKRAESSPLAFAMNETAVWSLADAFGVNSTLVKALFTAFDEATRAIMKAESSFSNFANVFKQKVEMDIKTTQRFADFIGRAGSRASSTIMPGEKGVQGVLSDIDGMANGNTSSFKGLVLLRAGVNPFEGAPKSRLLPSVSAVTTKERVIRLRKQRRAAPPALVADTQQQYRTIKTLPSKLKYDYERKVASRDSNSASTTMDTVFKVLPAGGRGRVTPDALLPRRLPGRVEACIGEGGTDTASTTDGGGGGEMESGVATACMSPIVAGETMSTSRVANIAIFADRDEVLLEAVLVDMRWVLQRAGSALAAQKQQLRERYDVMTVVEARQAHARMDDRTHADDIWGALDRLQALCIAVEGALTAASSLRLLQQHYDFVDNIEAEDPSLFDESRSASGEMGRVIDGEEGKEKEAVQLEQLGDMTVVLDGVLATMADASDGESAWRKTDEETTRLDEAIVRFKGIRELFTAALPLPQVTRCGKIEGELENGGRGSEVVHGDACNWSTQTTTATTLLPTEKSGTSEQEDMYNMIDVSVAAASEECDDDNGHCIGGVDEVEDVDEIDVLMAGEQDVFASRMATTGNGDTRDGRTSSSSSFEDVWISDGDHAGEEEEEEEDDDDDEVLSATVVTVRMGDDNGSESGNHFSSIPARQGLDAEVSVGMDMGTMVDTEALEQDTQEVAVVKYLITALDVSLFLVESCFKAIGPLLSDGGVRALRRIEQTFSLREAARPAPSKVQQWKLLKLLKWTS